MIPKFRVWDKNQQVMRGVKGLFWHKNNLAAHCSPIGNKFDEFFTTILNDGEYHLMQSTGLVDKNGVQIFEGDVVAIENHPFQKTDDSDVGMEINGNYEVGWNADDLTWCAGSLLLARVKNYVIVVGNIYENSDLLEV